MAQVKLPPATQVTIQWEHDGGEDAQFRLLVDSVVVKTWTAQEMTKSATANSVGDFTYTAPYVAGFNKGNHTVQVEAFNAFASTASDPLSIMVGTAPRKPKNTTITVIISIR